MTSKSSLGLSRDMDVPSKAKRSCYSCAKRAGRVNIGQDGETKDTRRA